MFNFTIRRKLFLSFSLLVLVALAASFFVVESNTEKVLQQSIQNELGNSTALINTLVETLASSSIENHLRTIAETQRTIVSGIHDEFLQGRYSEEEAKALAAKLMLRQDIGTSGYLYCLDSRGLVTVHRDKQVEGSNVSSFPFVQRQLELKTGYIEYRWKNPGEPKERDKALYMTYFEPWDWIISASAYKNEFRNLIDRKNIHLALDQVHFGASGYPFIIQNDGRIIYHPQLQDNIYSAGIDTRYVETVEGLLRQRNGTIFYEWQNPGERVPRHKIALVRYLEDYDWLVGTSAYMDELDLPLVRVRHTYLLLFGLCGLATLLGSYWLSFRMTRPLNTLMAHFRDQDPTEVKTLSGKYARDEIGQLARYLNLFITRLKEHHLALDEEIVERRRSEKALRESEQTFHALFDNSFQFIALLDMDCRVRKINRTALNFRNLTADDVLGNLFWETPWFNHSPQLVRQIIEAIEVARKGRTGRFEAYSNQVREVFLDITVKPVLDDDNRAIFLIAEARDVTDIRRAEQELQQAQKMESVGILAGGIAHDFNNILGGILGTLTLLKLKRDRGRTLEEEELFRHLDTMNSTVLRAREIVNQLMTLSRKHELEFSSIDLVPLIENVRQIAHNSFDKSIQFETRIAEKVIPVYADSNSLEQVLLNICINAAHAMTIMRPVGESWGGNLLLSVERTRLEESTEEGASDYWRLSINDTGVGMDTDTLTNIFVPFFTTKQKGTGSGLGLAMVYNIVRQHRGYINVESHPGDGTRFEVLLPANQEAELAEGHPAEELLLVSGEGLILVVDDEELIRNNARDLLVECGYRVLVAENGAEGVRLFEEHRQEVSAVLLDLVMPVMSGRAAFKALRKIDPQVKVLLSSGFRQDHRVEELLAAGANAFIQKPYALQDLSLAVSRLLVK